MFDPKTEKYNNSRIIFVKIVLFILAWLKINKFGVYNILGTKEKYIIHKKEWASKKSNFDLNFVSA